jgi:ABC-type antimicrobial peptide transport system permease subunit
MQFVVRAPADPAGVARAVRKEITSAIAGTTVNRFYTLDENIAVAAQELLVGTAPLFPLIATGLLLTTAGIYGVLAFAMARRSKELALRVAIGASAADLARLVSAHSLRLVTTGTVLGIAATYALARVVRASGGGGSVFDPAVNAFVAPVAIIMVITTIATWIPSRRAMRVDPAVLLRSE